MIVRFQRSGGFAARLLGCQLDTQELAADEAARLEALVEAAGIARLKDARVQAARDVFYYTFAIETAAGTKRVTFDQLSLPASVRPLIEFLMERSTDQMLE